MRLEVSTQKQLKNFALDIQFTTEIGCLGILGSSGCGKSMTLKSIAGIVRPDQGEIKLYTGEEKGQETNCFYDSKQKINLAPQKRQVGYLFQNYALFPNMTVTDNIAVGLRTRKVPKDQQQRTIAKMIQMFHLEGLEKQYPMKLSGGQQQRVALARNLAFNPKVLLLDEPFSAIDTYLRDGLRLELQNILKDYEGISIMVTHDRDEAYQLCNNLLLLDRGRVLQSGSTRDIFEHPKTPKAAILTGCKNISKVERLGNHRVRALDWKGIELTVFDKVTDKIRYIGIRAHDFIPAAYEGMTSDNNINTKDSFERCRENTNLIPVGKASISEMPFEWYVTLENRILWKTKKTIHFHDTMGQIPEYLHVNPKAILILEEDET